MEENGEQDIINLLVTILSIYHKHDKKKQGTMELVKTDTILSTI